MKDYILVYLIDDYPDNGGGLQFESYADLTDLDKAVENIFGKHEILVVGEVRRFEYQAKEVVTKVERLT